MGTLVNKIKYFGHAALQTENSNMEKLMVTGKEGGKGSRGRSTMTDLISHAPGRSVFMPLRAVQDCENSRSLVH